VKNAKNRGKQLKKFTKIATNSQQNHGPSVWSQV